MAYMTSVGSMAAVASVRTKAAVAAVLCAVMFCNGHSVVDHLPIVARFEFSKCVPSFSASSRAAPRTTKHQLRDPSCVAKFTGLLEAIVSPPWTSSLQTHYKCISKRISAATRCAFPIPKLLPRKPYASQQLLCIFSQRIAAKKELALVCRTAKDPIGASFLPNLLSYKACLVQLLSVLRKSLVAQSKADFAQYVIHCRYFPDQERLLH